MGKILLRAAGELFFNHFTCHTDLANHYIPAKASSNRQAAAFRTWVHYTAHQRRASPGPNKSLLHNSKLAYSIGNDQHTFVVVCINASSASYTDQMISFNRPQLQSSHIQRWRNRKLLSHLSLFVSPHFWTLLFLGSFLLPCCVVSEKLQFSDF